MNKNEFRAKHMIFYVIYIIGNVFTLGTWWFLSNLIAYSVSKSEDY